MKNSFYKYFYGLVLSFIVFFSNIFNSSISLAKPIEPIDYNCNISNFIDEEYILNPSIPNNCISSEENIALSFISQDGSYVILDECHNLIELNRINIVLDKKNRNT